MLRAEIIAAMPPLAQQLDVAPGEELVLLERVRLADGRPMCIQTSHVIHALCPGILRLDFSRASLFAVLEREYHLVIGRPTHRVRALPAGPREAELLHLAPSACILHVESYNHLASGRVFEFVVTDYRADRYEMIIGA